MGSFNETCALSNLNIGCGTPVRQVFLTQNPYVRSDQREAHRGCYHYDQWFVRTPPIKGTYNDYGDIEFKEGPLTELICRVFQKDAIERPFGFNQYHAGDVTLSKGIHHFLHAAWQGRLLVHEYDDDRRQTYEEPDHFPTWRKVHALLKKARLPIQLESDRDEGREGYNCQPVVPGVVCVDFNSYGDNTKRYSKAIKVLSKVYDCQIVNKFPDRPDYENCVMVAPKGAFDDPKLLCDVKLMKEYMDTHPDMHRMFDSRSLPVLSVMIREDVWQLYCNIATPKDYFKERATTVDAFLKQFKKILKTEGKEMGILRLCEMVFRDCMISLPFMASPVTHLVEMVQMESEGKYPAEDKAELVQSVAELARIEYVMAFLHRPWYIPPLGGQEGWWELQAKMLKGLGDIAQTEYDKEKAEQEEWQREEDEMAKEDDDGEE